MYVTENKHLLQQERHRNSTIFVSKTIKLKQFENNRLAAQDVVVKLRYKYGTGNDIQF